MTAPETGFRRLSEDLVHQGHIWYLATAEFESPRGERFRRDIVRSPGAVGVVPIVLDAQGETSVVLVAQYRPPYDEVVIEIPAGMRDVDGEDPADVARRELVEEAGLQAGGLQYLTAIFPSPGMTDSVTTLYLATDCTPTPTNRQGPEEQEMEVHIHPLGEAVEMIERGEIRDAKTVVGLLLAARRVEAPDRR